MGVTLRLHVSFGFLLLFVWGVDAVQGHAGTPRSFALVAMIFGSVLLHELGHALMARRGGIGVKAIILLPLGGITVLNDENNTRPEPGLDLRISAAGPLINLLLALLAGSLLPVALPWLNLWQSPWVTPAELLRSFFWMNLFLGVFNLLPAYPLDGGRVLRAWYAQRMDPIRATRKAISVGQIFAALFFLAGVLMAGWNGGWWLAMTGIFLYLGAQMEDRSAVFQTVLQSVRMADVMLTDFRTLSPADTLQDAIDKAVHWLQDDFPVVRGNDMVGAISRQRILSALRAEGNGYVQGVMSSIAAVAGSDDSLASVLRRLNSSGSSLIPIVENEKLIGIVTLQNLSHSMSLLAESRRLKQMAAEEGPGE
jgi:Zn-dependent protease/predicted transcriptional regulator